MFDCIIALFRIVINRWAKTSFLSSFSFILSHFSSQLAIYQQNAICLISNIPLALRQKTTLSLMLRGGCVKIE